jgi:hypothetical protein
MARVEHTALSIKTREGKRIYDRAVRYDGSKQLAASKSKSEKVAQKLLKQGREHLTAALAEALALNPKPRKKRITKLKWN